MDSRNNRITIRLSDREKLKVNTFLKQYPSMGDGLMLAINNFQSKPTNMVSNAANIVVKTDELKVKLNACESFKNRINSHRLVQIIKGEGLFVTSSDGDVVDEIRSVDELFDFCLTTLFKK